MIFVWEICLLIFNFVKKGRVEEMLEDVDQAIKWTIDHIDKYGGDKHNIYLAGQSAGAHLGLMSILRNGVSDAQTWKLSKIKGFIGISGPYDIIEMKKHFHARGLNETIYSDIFSSPNLAIEEFSPTNFVATYLTSSIKLPHLFFFHGTNDKSCPHVSTEGIVNSLLKSKAQVSIITKYYPNKSHTDLILEDLMHDESIYDGDVVHDISQIVHEQKLNGHVEYLCSDPSLATPPVPRRRTPSFIKQQTPDPFNSEPTHASQTIIHSKLLALARFLNPF